MEFHCSKNFNECHIRLSKAKKKIVENAVLIHACDQYKENECEQWTITVGGDSKYCQASICMEKHLKHSQMKSLLDNNNIFFVRKLFRTKIKWQKKNQFSQKKPIHVVKSPFDFEQKKFHNEFYWFNLRFGTELLFNFFEFLFLNLHQSFKFFLF